MAIAALRLNESFMASLPESDLLASSLRVPGRSPLDVRQRHADIGGEKQKRGRTAPFWILAVVPFKPWRYAVSSSRCFPTGEYAPLTRHIHRPDPAVCSCRPSANDVR